jgi:hypothetical protein
LWSWGSFIFKWLTLFKVQSWIGARHKQLRQAHGFEASLAGEKGVSKIQVFGDSMNAIKWLKGEQNFINYLLASLVEEIRGYCTIFTNIFFIHIYRERNSIANALSKFGLQMNRGQ